MADVRTMRNFEQAIQIFLPNYALPLGISAAFPPKNFYRSVETHGRSRKDQQIRPLDTEVSNAKTSKLEEMFAVSTALRTDRLQLQEAWTFTVRFTH